MKMKTADVAIIGAGGAGMMCAMTAGRRGKKVILIDHASNIGKKILISGGGRCNFTNIYAGPDSYVSNNPHFVKSSFARYTPGDFIELVEKHKIPYHEKKLGQLFCDRSAQDIVDMLVNECKAVDAKFWMNTRVQKIIAPAELRLSVGPFERLEASPPIIHSHSAGHKNLELDDEDPDIIDDEMHKADSDPAQHSASDEERAPSGKYFVLETSKGKIAARCVVIATGGLSIPKIGATGFGYDAARHFGLRIVAPAPALDGFLFDGEALDHFEDLQGVSVDSEVTCNDASFRENILFTHSGLSGPASLQASLYWRAGDNISIDLTPDTDIGAKLLEEKANRNRQNIRNILPEYLPKRLAQRFCWIYNLDDSLQHISDEKIRELARNIRGWNLSPARTVGYKKAEVTRGGVDTNELSSKTMESTKVPGLYFIGEVVDVTGQLGGYNFQWAWASGFSAGESV